MSTSFDQRTESDRERDLIECVRSGQLSPTEMVKAVPEFPLKVQIQTFSRCNATCITCPWPETSRRLPQGYMSESLYRRLIEQLAEHGVERTGLFLMNEPLLDARLPVWTELLKEHVPNTVALIYTNGTQLDAHMAQALADSGMDEINISMLGFDADTYEQMMGLDFARVLDNLDQVTQMMSAGLLGSMSVRIVCLDTAGACDGIGTFRSRFPFPIDVAEVSNRAGSVDTSPFRDAPEDARVFRACQRPFVKSYVLYSGDVVLCNSDWNRTTILGNLGRQSLRDIWSQQRLTTIRCQHLSREIALSTVCAGCDYPYPS